MIDTVFLVRDIFDKEVYIIFSNEKDAEQYIKNDPHGEYMTIHAYVLHHKLT